MIGGEYSDIRRVIIMEERRYRVGVNVCVHGLRIAMIIIAVLIPVVCTIHSSVLNKMMGTQLENVQVKYLFNLVYSEIVLGYLLSLFLNFREKEIFCLENMNYLRRVGKLIIAKEFIYIPIDFFFYQSLTIPFNVTSWLIGGILVLFSRLLEHGMREEEEQNDLI